MKIPTTHSTDQNVKITMAEIFTVFGKSRSSGLISVTPASIDPDQRSTVCSITISKTSSSRRGRLDITMASLNSPKALGRVADRPLLLIRALRPDKWKFFKINGAQNVGSCRKLWIHKLKCFGNIIWLVLKNKGFLIAGLWKFERHISNFIKILDVKIVELWTWKTSNFLSWLLEWVIEALVWSNFWVLAKMLHLSLKV